MKKGFTLIEIVVVIFVLGLLFLLVASPIVKNIKDTKNDLCQTQTSNIRLGAENWVSDHLDILPENGTVTLTLGDLKNGGYVDDKLTNPINKKQFSNDINIEIKMNDKKVDYNLGDICSSDNDDEINKNGPTIVLGGKKVEYLEVDFKNNEPVDLNTKDYSCNAIDKDGKSINCSYTIQDENNQTVNNIYVNKLNKYKITYQAKSNNLVKKVYKTVIVRDTTKPVITVDNHTTSFSVNVTKNENYTIPSATVSDNSGENIKADVSGILDVTKNGAYKIIYSAKDSSKNEAKLILTIYVNTNPACNITIDNLNYTKSAVLKINTNDYLIDGYAFDNDEFSNKKTKKITKNGHYVAKVKNNMGVISTCKIDVTNIDNQKPKVTFDSDTYLNNRFSNIDYNAIINIKDDVSGIDNDLQSKYCSTMDGSNCTPNQVINYNDGDLEISENVLINEETDKFNICVWTRDRAHNENTVCSKDVVGYYKLDKTKPVLEFTNVDKTNGKENDVVTFTLKLKELHPKKTDLSKNVFYITGDAKAKVVDVTKNNDTYLVKVKILSGNGIIALVAKENIVSDEALNTNISVTSMSINVDNLPPTITFDPTVSSWSNTDYNVKVNVTDSSNVDSVLYCVTNLDSCTPSKILDGKVTIDTEGKTNKICVKAIDGVLNVANVCSDNYLLDKTKPVCEITGNKTNWTNQDIELKVKGKDDLSGPLGVKKDIDTDYTENLTSVVTNNGTYNFDVIDNAGNENNCEVEVTKIDKTKPVIKSASASTEWTYEFKKITINSSDGESGLAGYQITNSLEEPSVFIKNESETVESSLKYGNGTYYVWVKDKASNISDPVIVNVTNIDRTKPIITYSLEPNDEWNNQDINVLIQAKDDESQIKSLKYCLTNSVKECVPNIDGNINGQTVKIENDGDKYQICSIAVNNASLETQTCTSYDSKYYKLDKTYPSCELTVDNEACTNKSITASISGTDDLSGLNNAPYAINDDNFTTNNTKLITSNGTIIGKVKDAASNISTCSKTVNNIDTVGPKMNINVTPNTLDGNNSFYKTKPIFDITGTDEGCAGYSGYYYDLYIDDVKTKTSEQLIDNSSLNNDISNNECKVISADIYGVDGVGNESKTSIKKFKFDSTKPTITVDNHTTDYEVSISVNGSYTIPTASATDNCGGDVKITKTSNLNPNVVGTYYVNYDATDEAGNTNTLKLTIKVVEPLMRSWISSSTDDFHSEEYRAKIKTIEIVDSINIPSDAIASFDVSENKDNSVMAWLTINSEDNTLYDLKIGGEGKVIANPDSTYLFYYFSTVTDIDLKLLDTSRVTSMGYMFNNCTSLITLDLSNFNTSNVTDMSSMFYNCNSLTTLDLSNFNTSKVKNMKSMFGSCRSLTALDLSSFDTSNVTDMGGMFTRCSSLIELNLSNFDISNVTDMSHMFFDCSSLNKLDIRNFDFVNVTNYNYIFAGMNSKINIYVKDETVRTFILNLSVFHRPSSWTTSNITITG